MVVIEAPLEISRHEAPQARRCEQRLVGVYAEVYAHKADDPFFSVTRFTERLRLHMSRPGYELVTGHVGGVMVGYAYGVPLPAGTLWWNGLIEPLPPELVHETGSRTFALNEIMVLAAWRRRGYARQLHDALLSGRSEERATLLVEAGNVPARTAYESWGWRQVGRLRPFADAPLYDSMILDLGEWRACRH